MEEISGGEVAARMLKQEAVDRVFGIIDGTYFGFYSSLRKSNITLISPRHETSAAHMAGAYARLTGKLGVCMASNGPGVANILPGLVVEEAEGNRVLCITSCRRTGISNPDRGGSYQYFDQSAVIARFAKWSAAVPSFERIPEMMRMALRKCFEGRPGVVHLDIPENIMNKKVKAQVALLAPHRYRTIAPLSPAPELVEEAARLLLASSAPIIHAGSGVLHAGACDELEAIAECLQAPVTTSWAARGALREDSPLAMPMIHVKLNHIVRNDADLVLTLGSRLGETDWWGKAPYWRRASEQKMIQVDIDASILGANKPVDIAVQADIGVFLRQLKQRLMALEPGGRRSDGGARLRKYARFRQRYRQKLDRALLDKRSPMHPAQAPAICGATLPEDTIFVADGGNTAVWANFYHEMRRPGSLLSTFKFGMLGAGVAQALGAASAFPDRNVCCIIGDGAMGFHPQEIETAVRNQLRVIFVVLCDKQWGMVKMNQQFTLKPWKTLLFKSLSPEETINADLGEIAFDRLAESMGAHGERVSHPDELEPALRRCMDARRCAVIHVDVDPVKHMWAPGLIHFKEMHLEPKG
ncbi:MAG: thiamine pyrophosphate-binding protein [Leptospirales bacterium]|nr:thiamine pyrophosphate-binding protein [Leptospirales bacterium]